MDYQDRLDSFLEKNPESIFLSFLSFLKDTYLAFLKGELTYLDISDITLQWFVTNENFSDGLVSVDNRIRQLRAGLDLTHPDISTDRKKLIVKDMLEIVEKIIEDHTP